MAAPAPWVLLRGLMRERGHWGDFAAALSRGLGDARVVCVDLPGNGALHGVPSPRTIEAMVEPVRAQLRAMGCAPPYRVFALSMGAMVAVAWAHAHPHELAARVLVNSSMRPFSRFDERLRPRNYPLLLRLALCGGSALQWERAVLRMTCNQPHPEVLAQWLQLRAQHPVSRANALRQLWAAARFRAPVDGGAVPTLVLASAADGLVSPRCSQAMAAHHHWPLRTHPDAGHDLPLDDPAWVVQQVSAWAPGQ